MPCRDMARSSVVSVTIERKAGRQSQPGQKSKPSVTVAQRHGICREATRQIICRAATRQIICRCGDTASVAAATRQIICRAATRQIIRRCGDTASVAAATCQIICRAATRQIIRRCGDTASVAAATRQIICRAATRQIICRAATRQKSSVARRHVTSIVVYLLFSPTLSTLDGFLPACVRGREIRDMFPVIRARFSARGVVLAKRGPRTRVGAGADGRDPREEGRV